MKTHQSKKLFLRAQKFLPIGAGSPIRSFRMVGGIPRFIKSSSGSHIKDIDRNEYIDYCLCFGTVILGHSHPQIIKVLKRSLDDGINYGTTTEYEVELAEILTKIIPSIETLKVVNSQTEAVMHSIRIARNYTRRDRIIKFDGCYHGESDSVLAKPSASIISVGIPEAPGVLSDSTRNTIVLPFNNVEMLRKMVRENYRTLAAIIINPVPTSMGVILPDRDFIEEIYSLTRKFGIILIFDETVTSFRINCGSVQGLFNLKADLTCIGKVLGNGFPIGIFGGKRSLMEAITSVGNGDPPGCLGGSPIIMQIALEIIKVLQGENVYTRLEEEAKFICDRIKEQANDLNIKFRLNQIGSIFSIFFTSANVRDYSSAKFSDARKYAVFFHGLLNQNIYFPPSPLEPAFLSLAHTDKDLEKTTDATYKALKEIKKKTV